ALNATRSAAMPSNRGGARPVKAEMVLDEKTARRLRRLHLRRVAMAASAVALMTAVIILYVSPLLRVQKVEVAGASIVDRSEVASLASFRGDSMLRLDEDAARERIEYLPMVRSVEIERVWPQKVRIKITERTPWGFWQVGADQYVIDAEGVVLPAVLPPEGSPVIVDLSNPVRLVAGDHVDIDAVNLTRTLLQRVPERLSLNISSLEFSADKGLTITTDAGYRVVVGDSQNMDYKLAVWLSIEQKLGRQAMAGHVLDLRFEDRPSFQ
ncbi:MAG: cell division protein FtsQ/DivIB, partial [Vicinamibacterales bacterium]